MDRPFPRLLAALALALPLAAWAQGPVADTTDGPVRGEAIGRGAVFRAIPYAAPPLGELRWKPPAPVAPWTEPRDATRFGPSCPQPDLDWNHKEALAGREDCLTLNVRTPNFKPDAKLPVMVWIHGGANWAGAAADVMSSTIVLHGIVLVSIQYRLGILGFLSHPALTAESGRHASGNYALMDQIAALKWVQANIAKFGGDPANVTIFGESAGAEDVGLLMVSPLARGLFERAIEESGTAGFGLPPRSLAENESLAADVPLDELRKMPVEQLLALQAKMRPPGIDDPSFLWLASTVDGYVLPKAPQDLPPAPVPLIVGANGRELHLFGSIEENVQKAFGANARKMRGTYGAKQADDLADDLTFRCPAQAAARRQTGPAWLYEFNMGPDLKHASELPYVFGQGSVVQAYWLNFARTGDPNGPSLPEWPRFEPKTGTYLDFTDQGPQVKARLRQVICQLLPRL
jgi:para-nitrobenzyl esterase